VTHSLTAESISDRSSVAATYPPVLGEVIRLDDQQRAQLMHETLMAYNPNEPFWLFGYGSLMWRPALPVVETVRAHVRGHHRGLCLWSLVSRGTPELPGLVLALARGGECQGVVHRLDPAHLESSLHALWARELQIDSYQPQWLACALADGRQVQGLGFVLRPDAPNYAGPLQDDVVRQVFARAVGCHGSALDYVQRTVQALQALGIRDEELESILERCG
jgi:cation transport protein ChaC